MKTPNKGPSKTPPGKQSADQVSELTTNRLSVYLRCLNELEGAGVRTISSQALAEQFHLNAAQIRKDLAYFGEFPWWGLPAMPVELMLLPNWAYFNMYELSSWSRATIIPLSIVMTERPVRKLPPWARVQDGFQKVDSS